MAGFVAKSTNENGEYEVKFYTNSEEEYKAVQDFCHSIVTHEWAKKEGESADER